MAKQELKPFYTSAIWEQTRKAYASSVDGLCERCLKKGIYETGKVVHHKKRLTPANVCDEAIALSFGNLELLCQKCHNEEHHSVKPQSRYTFDENGNVLTYKNGV